MRHFILIISLLLLPLSSHAKTIEDKATEFLLTQQDMIKKDLKITDKAKRFETLYNKIDTTFDVNFVYKFVVGKYDKKFNKEQKTTIIEFFKKLILSTYVIETQIDTDSFSFKANSIIKEGKSSNGERFVVDGAITDSKDNALIKIIFNLHYKNNKFLIADVKIEKVSMNFSFRKMFGEIMLKNGDDPEKLINYITIKNKEMDNDIMDVKDVEKIEEVFIIQ